MGALFLKVLGMSATAGVVILVVLLARLLLRRAPKAFSYVLWAVVLFRLLCPFVIQTPWSFTPSIQVEAAGESLNMVEINMERVEVVIRVDDPPVIHSESTPSDVPAGPSGGPSAPGFSAWAVAGIVWLAGVAALLGYSLISLLLLRRKLVGSVPLEGEKDVRLADYIPSPFVLGLFRPNIYLPSDLPEGERDYILLHERTHIRRCDHLFRALAWLALAVHWFNPLVWLAFHLAGRDMEMSCDEAVLRKMGRDVRADYSTSLLRLSTGKRLPAGPLAFGDGDPTSRIKNVLSYKKPALWVIVIALIGVLCAGVALATDRMAAIRDLDFPAFDPDSVTADLTFSLDETDEELGPVVRINGTVGDVTLPRGAIWYSNGLWKEQQPGGELSMVYPAFTDGIEGHVTAWWADESRRSVTLSTHMTAVLSSYLPTGYWTFTVDVDSGTVIEMTPVGFTSIEGDESAEVRYYPTSISDEEAVKAARVAAKLLTAAEDYYANAQSGGFSLAYTLDEGDGSGDVRIIGFGDGYASWSADTSPSGGNLYFTGVPASCCSRLVGRGIEGSAIWTNETRTAVSVVMNVNDHRTITGPTTEFYVYFAVELDSGAVVRQVFESEVEGETLELTEQEMVSMARVLAQVLEGAEDYYNNSVP